MDKNIKTIGQAYQKISEARSEAFEKLDLEKLTSLINKKAGTKFKKASIFHGALLLTFEIGNGKDDVTSLGVFVIDSLEKNELWVDGAVKDKKANKLPELQVSAMAKNVTDLTEEGVADKIADAVVDCVINAADMKLRKFKDKGSYERTMALIGK